MKLFKVLKKETINDRIFLNGFFSFEMRLKVGYVTHIWSFISPSFTFFFRPKIQYFAMVILGMLHCEVVPAPMLHQNYFANLKMRTPVDGHSLSIIVVGLN